MKRDIIIIEDKAVSVTGNDDYLGVIDSYKGKGVASLLFQTFLEICRKEKYDFIVSDTNPDEITFGIYCQTVGYFGVSALHPDDFSVFYYYARTVGHGIGQYDFSIENFCKFGHLRFTIFLFYIP